MSKKEMLLSRVIVEYLKHREPIGSESLKMLMDTKISSATIRNYFKALADEGLLFQPHISSGRIPTPQALKSYWYRQFDTKSVIEIDSFERIKKACFESQVFCAVSIEQSNRLCAITRLDEQRLLLEFEHIGITLPFSNAIERFLRELKGLEVSDVRKIAYQVRAMELLDVLSYAQSRNLSRFGVGALVQAYHQNSDEQSFYSIIDGGIFDILQNGIYCEEVLPKGYVAIIQDIELQTYPDKKSRMLCVGALDRDFTQFFEYVKS
ncbi:MULTISPECIES: HrcA family transcriptional regulator [Helicobacter]|uniref:Heat-inducible transcription repressor HrcA n=1 Tax=Helicobacter typhlonius TaxID=76936 RepID=A0A0S4PWU1_9HELI|nr:MULTISPECIES: HrcA family transcriptional regulator [Helicobacter]CUU40701.1 Heat-inducible transcription repressor HrcA [Helicobacter typhlonius]